VPVREGGGERGRELHKCVYLCLCVYVRAQPASTFVQYRSVYEWHRQ